MQQHFYIIRRETSKSRRARSRKRLNLQAAVECSLQSSTVSSISSSVSGVTTAKHYLVHMFARIVCTLLMVFVRQFQLPSSQYPQLVSTAFIECADAYIHGYRYVHMVRRNLLIMPIKVIVRWLIISRSGD